MRFCVAIILILALGPGCSLYADNELSQSKDTSALEDSIVAYERASAARYKGQIHYEDSLLVFWTRYPDPFSPKLRDIRTIGKAKNYYNCIDGLVQIGITTENSNKILYLFSELDRGTFWIGFCDDVQAIEEIQYIPYGYYLVESEDPIDLVLVVDERMKSRLPLGLKIPVGKYLVLSKGR